MPKGTRENIINAFFSLASKHPSSTHFTLTQIAKEAGISRQSIYQNHLPYCKMKCNTKDMFI